MRVAKHVSRRFLASAVIVPLVAGGVVLLNPGVAEAVTCGQSWTNKDPGGGAGIVDPANGYTFPLHTGDYGDCRVTWWVSDGVRLDYDCFRANDKGNTWTHVRAHDDPTVSGWAWDNYLNDGGSTYAC